MQGLRASPTALQADIGTPIAQHHQTGRHAQAALLQSQFQGQLQRMGQGCAAATGQTRQAAFGSHQRLGGRQQDLGMGAAKPQHTDLIATRIRLRQQQLDCALGLGQAVQGRRTRGVDGEDQTGLGSLGKAVDMKVFGTNG